MPPIRITGAIKAITAEKSKYQSSASSTTRPSPTAKFTERPATTNSQTAIGNPRTMKISRDADPNCGQENGESMPQRLRWATLDDDTLKYVVKTTPGDTP